MVDLTLADDGVRVVMTVEPLHDQVWTERLVAGRANELDNLAAIIAKRNEGQHRLMGCSAVGAEASRLREPSARARRAASGRPGAA